MSDGRNPWRRRLQKLRAHNAPGRFLVSRALWHSGLSRLLTVNIGDGLRIRFFPSSLSAALWAEPLTRSEDADFLALVLGDGDNYVDCGANIGYLTLIARRLVGDGGRVTAIEAHPRIFGYCVHNLELNGFRDVQAVNVALGEVSGTTSISNHRSDDQNVVGQGKTRVGMQPLDDLLGSEPVTLLKLDVEGYELQVLRGARRTLARTKIVYCELSADNAARFGNSPQEAEALLTETGFVLARRAGADWQLEERSVFATLAATDQPATGFNLVAIRRDAVDEFAARVGRFGQRVQR